ncbi:uncharacterized protein LOC131437547 [Malaya genurostris]|uniref:uncharacterized protein LOC131437547 n=1 Tax=Malaya genurostris TaxID=325434 RepID=UPI0026F398B6|nr:uncharacterized protein LOC131437547 [Malaya genurostris]
MKLLVLCLFLSAVTAETPFAGYAPSGWRPQGAQFKLPSEYGAPVVQETEVEITKENIEHAGQIVESTTDQNPSNEYLPPTTTDQPELDPIRVQGLPDNQFKDFQRSRQQQTARLSANRFANTASKQTAGQQTQAFFALNGQLRVLPVDTYVQFGRQQQVTRPDQAYGVPNQDTDETADEDVPVTNDQSTEQPESNDGDEEDQSDPTQKDNRPVIAVSNAFSGQYYIVGQDNKLQRVMYSTSQSEDDRRQMGFTAQLRYSPVEPIQGPVYAYNEQGQLIRIYK